MSKKKKKVKKHKSQINDTILTKEIFDAKLEDISLKLNKGKEIIAKADTLLYEVLSDMYQLSAEFSGDENDEAHRILQEKCEQVDVTYDETDIQRTLLKLVIKNPYEKGSPERKRENARIATYARALNKLAESKIEIDDVLRQLESYGIDYWANDREKEDAKKNSANSKTPPLSKQTLNFFNRHNVQLNSFMIFAIGDEVYCSNDDELIKKLKRYKKDKTYEFDDINIFGKREGQ